MKSLYAKSQHQAEHYLRGVHFTKFRSECACGESAGYEVKNDKGVTVLEIIVCEECYRVYSYARVDARSKFTLN